MTRHTAQVGDRIRTDDGDGVTREWDAATHAYITTQPAPNTQAPSPERRSQ